MKRLITLLGLVLLLVLTVPVSGSWGTGSCAPVGAEVLRPVAPAAKAAFAASPALKETRRRAWMATVTITNKTRGTGGCGVIADVAGGMGFVASCKHIVRDRSDSFEASIPGQAAVVPCKLLDVSPSSDLAVFVVPVAADQAFVPINATADTKIGDPLFQMGYPQGYKGTGPNVRTAAFGGKYFSADPAGRPVEGVWEMSSGFWHGDSGSGVFRESDGLLVGIAVWTNGGFVGNKPLGDFFEACSGPMRRRLRLPLSPPPPVVLPTPRPAGSPTVVMPPPVVAVPPANNPTPAAPESAPPPVASVPQTDPNVAALAQMMKQIIAEQQAQRQLIQSIPAGPPGPAGKDGADGKPGAMGPAGPPGKDADMTQVLALQQQVQAMQQQMQAMQTEFANFRNNLIGLTGTARLQADASVPK